MNLPLTEVAVWGGIRLRRDTSTNCGNRNRFSSRFIPFFPLKSRKTRLQLLDLLCLCLDQCCKRLEIYIRLFNCGMRL